MNRMRTWSLGAAGLAFLVLVAGWFLLISPAKGKVSDLQSQTAAQEQTNSGLQTQIAQLKLQNKNLPKQEAKLAQIRQHLPATPALPTFVRTLTKIAHDSGVTLVSVTPSAPVTMTTAVVVVTPSASPSSSDSSATAEAAPVAPTTTNVATGLKQIPVAINVTGGYYNIVRFLTKVEGLKRSMLVYTVGITPFTGKDATPSGSPSTSKATNKLTATISTRVFYSPPVQATPTTPVTGAAPAASGAAPATAS